MAAPLDVAAPPQAGIARLGDDFTDWPGLLALILRSFAYMDGVIDPPSSAHRLTAETLAEKARREIVFLARSGDATTGCLFLADRGDHYYLGKLAIDPAWQRSGLGRMLLGAAENFARSTGKPVIELQVRVELAGNVAAFSRLGFRETGRTAHDGFDRPTSITMRKVLA